MNIFKQATRDARFTAGGGSAELRMAAHLKELSQRTPGLEQYAILKFAEALETIPRTLAENAGQDTTSTVSDLSRPPPFPVLTGQVSSLPSY